MIRRIALLAALLLAFTVGVADARVPRPALDSASAGIVVDARSGQTMLSKRPGIRRPIASATKLMTALLVLESGKLGSTITAPPYNASPVESKINLRRGERMTVRDLMTALMLESANDAANALAVGIAGSRDAFVARMNRRARSLGLRNTHYANPIGFDSPSNYSSARDLVTLARKLMADKRFAAIVDRPRATLRSGDRTRTIGNRNRLVGQYRFVDGVKTGHTQSAGYVLVGAAHRNGGKVLSAVLGTPSEGTRDALTLALLRWGVDQFKRVTILRPGRVVAYAGVAHHPELRIRLTTRRSVTYTLRRGQRLRTRVRVPEELEGPIAAGRRVGSVDVLFAGRKVRTLGLVATRAVPGSSFFGRITDALGPPLTALALILVVLGGVLAGIRLRTLFGRGHRTAETR